MDEPVNLASGKLVDTLVFSAETKDDSCAGRCLNQPPRK
jgi:hypothetical protein